MDMIGKIETQPLKAAELLAAMGLCEAAGEMSPIEIAATRRVIRLLEAAEKMADAIEAYNAASLWAVAGTEPTNDERRALAKMQDGAAAFRNAMRGEL